MADAICFPGEPHARVNISEIKTMMASQAADIARMLLPQASSGAASGRRATTTPN